MTDADKAEYEGVIRLLTAKVEELAAENARLRSSESTAHSVLREVYNDPTNVAGRKGQGGRVGFAARNASIDAAAAGH
jgi:hypothetical protein